MLDQVSAITPTRFVAAQEAKIFRQKVTRVTP